MPHSSSVLSPTRSAISLARSIAPCALSARRSICFWAAAVLFVLLVAMGVSGVGSAEKGSTEAKQPLCRVPMALAGRGLGRALVVFPRGLVGLVRREAVVERLQADAEHVGG